MKRIGIDARLYFQTGVGVYIRNLLHYLDQMSFEDLEFYVYVLDEDASLISFTNKNFIKRSVPYKWHSFSEQLGFLGRLYRDHLDLMHFTYFSHPILYNRPFISTIHDVILLEHKTGKASTLSSVFYNIKHLAFTMTFYHQIKKGLRIITPSKTVKDQIVRIYGKQYADKIVPLYEGIDYEKMKVKEQSVASVREGKYFLYVGNFYPHKNTERLVEAFATLTEDVDLVFVGPKNYFSNRLQQYVQEHAAGKKVQFYYGVSDEKLAYLYKHAAALVNPSLSEGFGLPLIEAAYYGTPIIASDISVFKELFDSAYTAFNPTDVKDISRALSSFIQHPQKVNYEPFLKKYSFETMTHDIMNIYKELL